MNVSRRKFLASQCILDQDVVGIDAHRDTFRSQALRRQTRQMGFHGLRLLATNKGAVSHGISRNLDSAV